MVITARGDIEGLPERAELENFQKQECRCTKIGDGYRETGIT